MKVSTTPQSAMTTVITNTCKHDINLSNKVWVTMYAKATAGISKGKNFDFTPLRVRHFRNQVKQTCNAYSWGPVCEAIPVSSSTTSSLVTKNLVKEHKSILLGKVKKNAYNI